VALREDYVYKYLYVKICNKQQKNQALIIALINMIMNSCKRNMLSNSLIEFQFIPKKQTEIWNNNAFKPFKGICLLAEAKQSSMSHISMYIMIDIYQCKHGIFPLIAVNISSKVLVKSRIILTHLHVN
jgi:hypothetical protein